MSRILSSIPRLIALAAIAVACGRQPRSLPPIPERVECVLGGPLAATRGWAWGLLSNGRPQSLSAIEETTVLSVTLPSGRVIERRVRLVMFHYADGVIRYVNLWPLPERVPFSVAHTAALEFLTELGIEDHPEAGGRLASWRAAEREEIRGESSEEATRVLPWDDYGLNFEIEPGVWLHLKLQSYWKQGWIVEIQLYCDPVEGR